MSTPLIPITKVRLATKSNKVLKAYLNDNIIRKNGEEYCTVKDSLRGIAAIGEEHAYVDYWNEGTAPDSEHYRHGTGSSHDTRRPQEAPLPKG